MATPRETLKYYFRKYALPTEEQFGELIDAFVHKDEDMLTQEKIDGLTTALESKLSSEDFATAQAAINSAIEALQQADTTTAERLSAIEDDVATNADNIAGTILRVSNLESTVQEIVDGGGSGGGSDTTLYVKQIADLDTYEGTTGEIVQYIGQTTSTRTRGFFYEKKEGDAVSLPAHTSRLHIVNLELKDGAEEDLNGWYVPTDDTLTYCLPNTMNTGSRVYGLPLNANSQYVTQSQGLKTLGEVTNVYSSGYTEFASGQSFTAAEMQRLNDETKYLQSTIWKNVQTGKKIILWSNYNSSSYNLVSTNANDTILATDGEVITGIYSGISSSGDEQNTIWKDPEDTIEIGSTPASWQVIPVGPCVN